MTEAEQTIVLTITFRKSNKKSLQRRAPLISLTGKKDPTHCETNKDMFCNLCCESG